jgi:glutamate-1-semialdehyde 2,1-aminomutase
LAFADVEAIRDADAIDGESMKYFKSLFGKLLNRGVYLGPSGYEVGFVSAAHTPELLSEAATIIKEVLDEVDAEIGF